MSVKRTILVTSALPYANNSLHLGHLLGYVQTDIWVRFQRLRGVRCLYVCASDAHGTPTMLRAEQEGIAPDVLIERVTAEHRRDFATFDISVDNYLTTHSPGERGADDRAVPAARGRAASSAARSSSRPTTRSGRCSCRIATSGAPAPSASTPDQYGDSCENCGATYSPLDLQGRGVDAVRHAAHGPRVRAPVPEARHASKRSCTAGSASTWTERSCASSTSGSRRA